MNAPVRANPTASYLVAALALTWLIPGTILLPVGDIQLTPTRFVAILLLPMLVFGRSFRWGWPDLVCLSVFLSMFVSMTLKGGAEAAIVSTGRHILDHGVAYLAGRYLAADLRRFYKAMPWIALVMSLLVVTLVIESVARVNLHMAFWQMIGPVRLPPGETRLGLTRAQGWTSHPIMLAQSYVTLLPIVLYAALNRSRLIGRAPWLKVAAYTAAVFLGLSSGPWVAAAMVMALVVWDKMVFVPTSARWLAVLVGGPAMYLGLEVMAERPLLRILMMKLHLTSPDAWWYRWRLYERVYDQMPGNWLLGHGLEIPVEFTGTTGWSIDNNYLVVLLLRGVVGVGVWIGFMVAVVFYKLRAVWLVSDDALCRLARACGIIVLGSAAAQITVALFSTAEIVFYFSLGLAVTMAQHCDARLSARRRPRPAPARASQHGAPAGAGAPRQ